MTVPSADNPLNDPNIYLTTSMDCTAKVWSRLESHPLVSFEDRNDYLLHCDWSPSHPALFATVAMSGHLDIWNLNINSEVSVTVGFARGLIRFFLKKFFRLMFLCLTLRIWLSALYDNFYNSLSEN
ncbi:unnamed protein product [Hydatigera taeniaeformis]|uniref:WD_REPEATS_REGION domain-containing protein n=1 Tax=Hydatigena taeniaeformis TaxID=6205 RepID=A0A0R3WWQ1_HYDTA|nr:unnamed protein product [Hydatigera taeniaeformis]